MRTSYATKIKQQRGKGKGRNYIPWIKVGEFSGSGVDTRVLGLKSQREHHFFSHFEASLFYIFDLDNEIEDIREQFPLQDIDLAKELAEKAGIKYPPSRDDDKHVLTSDYLLTYKDGQEIALTIKYLKDITNRQLELFEIERRYWDAKGIQWKLITEKEMPEKDLLMNYRDIHNASRRFLLDKSSEEEFQEMICSIFEYYNTCLDQSLTQFTDAIDSELNIPKGSTLMLIKVLIAKKMITTDLTKPLVSSKRKMQDLNFIIKNASNIRKSDLAA